MAAVGRLRPTLADGALLAGALCAFVLFPDQLGLLTRILIMMVFVLSIDLVLGYAGVDTLGQAAMYGAGAYAAGIFCVRVSAEPLLGLAVGGLAGAAMAIVSGIVLIRLTGLTLIVMSIAVAQVCQEIANQARSWTGGADGLSISVDALLGRFSFDLAGNTAYWYAFAVLALAWLALRVLTASPLGLTARGIRESRKRMASIGSPVGRRLLTLYAIAGAIAGVAGALSAQVTELVSLEVFGFVLSAEAVLMLVLGGAGRLVGALIGPALFMGLHEAVSAADPYTWLAAIGALVIAVVFLAPKGVLDLPGVLRRFARRT